MSTKIFVPTCVLNNNDCIVKKTLVTSPYTAAYLGILLPDSDR